MTFKATTEDFQWLVSPAARPWLDMAAADEAGNLVALTRRLRAELGAARAHLALELVELRKRAEAKFSQADAMFFTRVLLEQSTDQWIAAYKAGRFAAGRTVADLCCGIGGDLLALAGRGPATGIDLDPIVVTLARANCRAAGWDHAQVRQADASQTQVADYAAWHIDPDRRPQGTRTTRVELHEPGLDTLNRLRAANPQAAIKLAPAAEVPDQWRFEAEREWVGSRRECRQQVVWFGSLARFTGRQAATVVADASSPPFTICGPADEPAASSPVVGRFLFEPHAAVLAAGLTGCLANQFGLAEISPGIAYLTADAPVACPALAAFEVTDVLPFDVKRLKRLLRERQIGRLEVKRRGVPITPEEARKRLAPQGPRAAVLLLAPVQDRVQAILARRIH